MLEKRTLALIDLDGGARIGRVDTGLVAGGCIVWTVFFCACMLWMWHILTYRLYLCMWGVWVLMFLAGRLAMAQKSPLLNKLVEKKRAKNF